MELHQGEGMSLLADMDEYEFEQLVADLWENQGWTTSVTSGSGDRGIDVIAEKHDPFYQKQLIQAKRYSRGNKVGSPDIQQYSSLRHQEDNVDAVVVVTTSSFSREAQKMATDLNVKLVDGDALWKMVREHGGEELLEQYFTLPTAETGATNDGQSDGSIEGGTSSTSRTGRLRRDTGYEGVSTSTERDTSTDDNSTSASGSSLPPHTVPKSVYHNENWGKTKLAIKLPLYAFIGYFVVYLLRELILGPVPDEVGFETTPILMVVVGILSVTIIAGALMFLIYVSRDKAVLHEETGQSKPRHPITLAAFVYFTGGLYVPFYLIARYSKYNVSE